MSDLSIHDQRRIFKYQQKIDDPFCYVGMRGRILDLVHSEVDLVKFLMACDYDFKHDDFAMVEHSGRGLKNEK